MGYNAIEINGEVKLDLSEDTVTEETLPEGVTAHDSTGEPIVGKMKFVKSINSKTGDVTLGASDVGADASGTAATAVSKHNTNTEAHNDIRLELQRLNGIINDILDSEDPNLDEMHEVVAYIKSNKTLIEAITDAKVNVVDIIDNLFTNVANRPLSAAQGVVIKGLIDDQKILIDKFSAWYDENHYVKMTGSFTATNSGGTFEIGRTVQSKFTWEFTKVPTTLTVGGKSVTPIERGETDELTFTMSSPGSTSFSIEGVFEGPYGDEPASKTWTYNFQSKRYWGCAEKPEAPKVIDSAFIKSLSRSDFITKTSISKTFNLNDSTLTKFVWYAYPKRLGKVTFTSGGYAGGFDSPVTVSVTNSYNVTEDYYVYRSTIPGVGDMNIVVSQEGA